MVRSTEKEETDKRATYQLAIFSNIFYDNKKFLTMIIFIRIGYLQSQLTILFYFELSNLSYVNCYLFYKFQV